MLNNLVAGVAALPGWNLSLLMLLTKATIILIAALGITLSMQRASAGARHLVWLVTLGTLLLVPLLAAWAPLRVAVLPAPATRQSVNAIEIAPRAAQSEYLPGSAPESAAPAVSAGVPLGAMPRMVDRFERMGPLAIALAVWATVVLGIMLSLGWAGLAVRRIVRHATPLTSPEWVNPLFEIADRLGLEDAPRLLQSDAAKMPFACGVLAPTIVLPTEAEGWTLDRRRAVLLHELAHVRRHDLLGHTLGRLTCAVYWFHPLVWTAAKKLRNESERACDDLALSCGTRATDYAEHLLDIVTSVRGDSTPLVALAMARRKEFEGRMLAILDPELRHNTLSRRQSATLAGTLTLISLTVAAAAPVQRAAVAGMPQRAAQAHAPVAPEVPHVPAVTMRVKKSYPDSGTPGAIGTHSATDLVVSHSTSTKTSVVTFQSQSQSQSQSQMQMQSRVSVGSASPTPHPDPVASTMADVRTSGEMALNEIAKAGIHLGLNAATAALEGIGQSLNSKGDKGSKGPKGSKSSDDRPVLLAKVLKTDTSASLRRIAAWGLQEYADSPVATEALASALKRDADTNVREMAAWALGNGGDGSSASTSALTTALRTDASEKVRATSAWALGNMGDHASADALTSALGDASPEVRMRAAWALGSVEPRQAPRALVALLTDKDVRTRELAAWALFQIEDPSTAPAIEAALKTEQNKDVQLAYIRAIAAMGEKSVDVLKGLLDSPDPRVKAMAVRALAGGHATGPWPWPWPMPRPNP